MSEPESHWSTHNAVWSDVEGGWIEYENSNPPLRAKFPFWIGFAFYDAFILPIVKIFK